MIEFPPLNFSNRPREFNCYTDEQRSAVIYSWLAEGTPTRDMDRDILGITGSNGYQSHGIYRFLGLDRNHQGFFRGWKLSDIIAFFHKLCRNPDYCIIFYYFMGHIDKSTLGADDNAIFDDVKNGQPESTLKDQTWIRNYWIRNASGRMDIDRRLLDLPDIAEGEQGRLAVGRNSERFEYYSSTTVKETVKDLYDFRCQVCGDVILKTGWESSMGRADSWRYLSADVHHILPLSQGGPDVRANMLCLCPTCHRKFHSGEYRMKEKTGSFIVRDELLGKDLGLNSRHRNILF